MPLTRARADIMAAMELNAAAGSAPGDFLRYDHIQIFADRLEPLATYKALEAQLNAFERGLDAADGPDGARALWREIAGADAAARSFSPLGQDVVRQLMHGPGWRVVAHRARAADGTASVLVQSHARDGVKVVVTAPAGAGDGDGDDDASAGGGDDDDAGFGAAAWSRDACDRFFAAHGGRQGVGVLGFATTAPGAVEQIRANYAAKHPKLLVRADGAASAPPSPSLLEVYAYYARAPDGATADAPDRGTVLRFFEPPPTGAGALPGLAPVAAAFPAPRAAETEAFCDHWVSNVHDRERFLAVLADTLGFEPKVNFNAGVVAAGAAIIESTVAGNAPSLGPLRHEEAERSHAQVYLPINNALSSVGHVHGFLEELGQGVQHVASRVADLPGFVARAAARRDATGVGLAFLNIPRSYYGVLTVRALAAALGDAGESAPRAAAALRALEGAGLVDAKGAVDLDADDARVRAALAADSGAAAALAPGGDAALAAAAACALRSRYANMHAILGDALDERAYLAIVRNKVLVDAQAGDVLMQIFSVPVLMRGDGDEAPFFEFIQRACGCGRAVKPGCGGFGIRNFLTLFLSIEVSKAMDEHARARARGDDGAAARHARAVDVFTHQLDVSNPVLTAISDAMQEEEDAPGADVAAAARARKEAAQRELQRISDEHKRMIERINDDAHAPLRPLGA